MLLVSALSPLVNLCSAGENGQDSLRVDLFLSVQPLVYNNNFDSAASVIDAYQKRFPADPAGWLTRSGLLLAWMTELEDDSLKTDFSASIDSALQLSGELDDSCQSNSAMTALLRGHAKTYLALYESKFGSKIQAVKKGYSAKGDYEAGLGCDSDFYDLYLGLGGFHFWKSVKGGVLRQVRILNNDIELGIKELKLARDSSLFSREPAINALIWVMIEQGACDTALTLCIVQKAKYPQSTMFDWATAKALFESGNYDQAISAYESLHQLYLNPDGNYFNVIECDKMIVECYKMMLKKREAAQAANRFYEYESMIPDKTRQRQRETIRYLEWWAKKASFYEGSNTESD